VSAVPLDFLPRRGDSPIHESTYPCVSSLSSTLILILVRGPSYPRGGPPLQVQRPTAAVMATVSLCARPCSPFPILHVPGPCLLDLRVLQDVPL
jgi:hypothetical protein